MGCVGGSRGYWWKRDGRSNKTNMEGDVGKYYATTCLQHAHTFAEKLKYVLSLHTDNEI